MNLKLSYLNQFLWMIIGIQLHQNYRWMNLNWTSKIIKKMLDIYRYMHWHVLTTLVDKVISQLLLTIFWHGTFSLLLNTILFIQKMIFVPIFFCNYIQTQINNKKFTNYFLHLYHTLNFNCLIIWKLKLTHINLLMKCIYICDLNVHIFP
jgi:hypothetical protein